MNEIPGIECRSFRARPSFMTDGQTPHYRANFRILILIACFLFPVAPGLLPCLQAKEKPPTTYTIPLPPPPDFSPVEWLIGEWYGKTAGRDSQGEIRLSVTYDLEKHVVIFREAISLPSTKTIPAVNETWMGILSAGLHDSEYILRVFSTTGFTSRYRVTADNTQINFTPAGGEQPPPGWLFRRILARAGPDGMTETVEVAPPQKPFFDYYIAKLTRTKFSPPKSE
jgi:hypothetical protein